MQMFKAALFITASEWNPPKCLSLDEWIKNVVYPYNGISLSQKRNGVLIHYENIMLNGK